MYFFFFDSYVAVIGDIIQSKKIKNRYEVQNKLNEILNVINNKYQEDIASNFMITLGDEFQGLLKKGGNAINIISEIEAEMYPVQIRFGIGIGIIETDINPDIPLGADGPAYHNARKMIEKLKDNKSRKKIPNTNIMILSDNGNTDTDILLNTILSLCSTMKSKWTERQREVIFDCVVNGDNQIRVAERLGISQSSVQKSLSNSGYYSYKNAMDTVSMALSIIKACN